MLLKHSNALRYLESLEINLSDLILSILSLQQGQHTHLSINALNDLASNYYTILDAFRMHTLFAEGTSQWIHSSSIKDLIEESTSLSSKKTGWHGYAKSAKMSNLRPLMQVKWLPLLKLLHLVYGPCLITF